MSKKVYDNRELSWLKFNYRVLEEAQDNSVPVLERLLFQSIFSSNLDEFFMVRVGSLYDQSLIDDNERDGKTKMRPSEQLTAIFSKVRELNEIKDTTYKELSTELEKHGIYHKTTKSLAKSELEYLDGFFAYEIKPFLNAVVIDKRHPFPFLNNEEIYAVTKISSKSGVKLGIVSCGGKFDRVVYLPDNDGKICFLLVEDVILHYIAQAFTGCNVENKALMRITRNAEIDVDESFDSELDFRQNMSQLISKRKRLCPVRLQLSRSFPELALGELISRLELSQKQVFIEKTPLDFSYVFSIFGKAKDKKELFFTPNVPQLSPAVNPKLPMMTQIEKNDILLSYPYESINPFINLLKEASIDPDVESIKITLYRVAKNSKIIKALIAAAENGKDVTVLVELRARFDEENNINWSCMLEEAGCRIMYGPAGIKVHSKLCLITRRCGKQIKYTTQIGTGNYNEKTAELYTDMALMTADESIANDAISVFEALSLGKLVENTTDLLVAPHCLQNKLIDMMDNEIAIIKAGGEGYIGAKMNSLTDKVIIDKLIKCSQAGVKIDLVIRGISCLIAGVKDYTDNIHIYSIVGRYLEHSRIYIFGDKTRRKIYISSADFMTRNTTRRVEVAAPVKSQPLAARITDFFEAEICDNVKSRMQQADGAYRRNINNAEPLNSQEFFFKQAYNNAPTQIIAPSQPQKKKGFFAKLLAFFKKK